MKGTFMNISKSYIRKNVRSGIEASVSLGILMEIQLQSVNFRHCMRVPRNVFELTTEQHDTGDDCITRNLMTYAPRQMLFGR